MVKSILIIIIIKLVLYCTFVNSLSQIDSFYIKNLNDFGMFDGVKLDTDEKGLLLRASDDLLEHKEFYYLKKEWLLSSSLFYPFKEEIWKELNKISYDCDFHLNIDDSRAKGIIIAALQLMYYKLGDKQKARLLYSKKNVNFYESDFFAFELTNRKKEFFDILYNVEITGMFSGNEESIKLADNLTLITGHIKYMRLLKTRLIDRIKASSNINEDEKEYIFSFIFDNDAFNTALYLISNFSISVPNKEISVFDEESSKEEKIFNQKYQIFPEYDYLYFPLINLFRNYQSKIESKEEAKILSLNNYPGTIVMGLNYFVSKGSPIEITKYDNLNVAQYYEITGKFPNTDFLDYNLISFTFEKSKLTPAKYNICQIYGCSGFDIESFINSQDIKRNITYSLIRSEGINQELWNNFRLMTIKEYKLKNTNLLSSYFYNFLPIDFETDLLGYLGYYQYINLNDKETNDYVKLLYDYHKLTRYISSFNYFNNKVSKAFSNSKNLILSKDMLLLSIQRKRILNNHLQNVLEKSRDLLIKDILNIKKQNLI